MEEKENKQYGQPFKFKIGDKVVKILPSDLDNRYSGLDMSQPHEIESIEDFQSGGLGYWFQYIKIKNDGWHNGLDFRYSDNEMTPEAWNHMQTFFQDLRKQGKRKSRSTSTKKTTKKSNKITRFQLKKD